MKVTVQFGGYRIVVPIAERQTVAQLRRDAVDRYQKMVAIYYPDVMLPSLCPLPLRSLVHKRHSYAVGDRMVSIFDGNNNLIYSNYTPTRAQHRNRLFHVDLQLRKESHFDDEGVCVLHRFTKIAEGETGMKEKSPVPPMAIRVHALTNLDGGLLDGDDFVARVADDGDKIICVYEEEVSPPTLNRFDAMHKSNGSDGAEHTSSQRTTPDNMTPPGDRMVNDGAIRASITKRFVDAQHERFYSDRKMPIGKKQSLIVNQSVDDAVVEVDGPLNDTSGLSVREKSPSPQHRTRPSRRPTNFGNIDDERKQRRRSKSRAPEPPIVDQSATTPPPMKSSSTVTFSAEAKDDIGTASMARSNVRKSRLTQSMWGAVDDLQEKYGSQQPTSSTSQPMAVTLRLKCEDLSKPLGLIVEPVHEANATRLQSLRITTIAPDSRASIDGRLTVGDMITEIANRPVYQMSFERAQQYLNDLSTQPIVDLSVVPSTDSNSTRNVAALDDSLAITTGDRRVNMSTLQKANTKKLGSIVVIELVKGSTGLGFTVTTRDTATSSERPIYIKSVTRQGAADGRLRQGDRLMKINEQSIAGLSQVEVVTILRDVNVGATVTLEVSRVDAEPTPSSSAGRSGEESSSTSRLKENVQPASISKSSSMSGRIAQTMSPLPRPMTSDGTIGERNKTKELLVFDVALNDTGSAGLGISVKGRRSAPTAENSERPASDRDCGIYIKSVMNGGAAFKDGRLQVNDQLVSVDDVSLREMKNEDAMTLIGKTTQAIGRNASSIKLGVLRVSSRVNYNAGAALNTTAGNTTFVIDKEGVRRRSEDNREYRVTANGDYAMIVPNHKRTSNEQHHVNLYEDMDDVQSTVSSAPSQSAGAKPFDRLAVTRQSLNEKHHGTDGKSNPDHIAAFQKVKHMRQSSAPSTPISNRSVLRSHKVNHSARHHDTLSYAAPPISMRLGLPPINAAQRRSLSLESVNPIGKSIVPPSKSAHEMASANLTGAERGIDVMNLDANNNTSLPRPRHLRRDNKKEKEERRKSTGGGLLSKLAQRFGSGRSSSDGEKKSAAITVIPYPEPTLFGGDRAELERKRRQHDEERRRINEQYEKLVREQDIVGHGDQSHFNLSAQRRAHSSPRHAVGAPPPPAHNASPIVQRRMRPPPSVMPSAYNAKHAVPIAPFAGYRQTPMQVYHHPIPPANQHHPMPSSANQHRSNQQPTNQHHPSQPSTNQHHPSQPSTNQHHPSQPSAHQHHPSQQPTNQRMPPPYDEYANTHHRFLNVSNEPYHYRQMSERKEPMSSPGRVTFDDSADGHYRSLDRTWPVVPPSEPSARRRRRRRNAPVNEIDTPSGSQIYSARRGINDTQHQRRPYTDSDTQFNRRTLAASFTAGRSASQWHRRPTTTTNHQSRPAVGLNSESAFYAAPTRSTYEDSLAFHAAPTGDDGDYIEVSIMAADSFTQQRRPITMQYSNPIAYSNPVGYSNPRRRQPIVYFDDQIVG